MYCRIYTPGKTVISYKSAVKELYFLKSGTVEVFNNNNDLPTGASADLVPRQLMKDKPDSDIQENAILYLPRFSYFGDY